MILIFQLKENPHIFILFSTLHGSANAKGHSCNPSFKWCVYVSARRMKSSLTINSSLCEVFVLLKEDVDYSEIPSNK